MFENTYDFLAKIQKKKLQESEEGSMKPKPAKKLAQAKSSEAEVEHSVQQCTPQKGTPMKQMKKPKEKPAKSLSQGKSADGDIEHSVQQCVPSGSKAKSESKMDESVFVLAGIEEILGNEDSRAGALGAANIIAEYMGGKIDPQYQEFISMFTGILKRNSTADKTDPNVNTKGQ